VNLYLMRHALAAEPDDKTDDSLRSLTEPGRKKLKQIARNLKKLGISFDLVLTSPYLRACQTAEELANVLNIKPKLVVASENLTPPGFAAKLIDEINAHEPVENLLLIGHEPFISQLIGLLVAGEADLNIHIKKAGLCKLTIPQLTCGCCATLEWLLTPAQLQVF
jgi:phosphohistidine phosphatase